MTEPNPFETSNISHYSFALDNSAFDVGPTTTMQPPMTKRRSVNPFEDLGDDANTSLSMVRCIQSSISCFEPRYV